MGFGRAFLLQLPKELIHACEVISAYSDALQRVGKMTGSSECLLVSIDDGEFRVVERWTSSTDEVDESWASYIGVLSGENSVAEQIKVGDSFICFYPIDCFLTDYDGALSGGALLLRRPTRCRLYNSDEMIVMRALIRELAAATEAVQSGLSEAA